MNKKERRLKWRDPYLMTLRSDFTVKGPSSLQVNVPRFFQPDTVAERYSGWGEFPENSFGFWPSRPIEINAKMKF